MDYFQARVQTWDIFVRSASDSYLHFDGDDDWAEIWAQGFVEDQSRQGQGTESEKEHGRRTM